MIFLIVYDTKSGKLIDFKEYDDSSRLEAMDDLRRKQEDLLSDLNHIEVALFEGEARATLEQTHSRYFKGLSEIGANLSEAVRKSA